MYGNKNRRVKQIKHLYESSVNFNQNYELENNDDAYETSTTAYADPAFNLQNNRFIFFNLFSVT
jgi:hypothetical protein